MGRRKRKKSFFSKIKREARKVGKKAKKVERSSRRSARQIARDVDKSFKMTGRYTQQTIIPFMEDKYQAMEGAVTDITEEIGDIAKDTVGGVSMITKNLPFIIVGLGALFVLSR